MSQWEQSVKTDRGHDPDYQKRLDALTSSSKKSIDGGQSGVSPLLASC